MSRTLESVARQTVKPACWISVDDGSTDATPKILSDFAAKHSYLRVVQRDNRGRRSVGPGVVQAFYDGLNAVDLNDYDYLCKLDMDLELPPRYFELLIEKMQSDDRLATCSGKPFVPHPNRPDLLIPETCGDEMSVGMTKFYRREAFQQIGGFVPHVMWDGIDCHRCRMLGWKACSFDEPDLRFLHLRAMGSSHKGILTGRARHGAGQWFMGTGLTYMTASAVFRMPQRPWIVGGLASWLGYVGSALARKQRYDDPEFRQFLNRFQWAGLCLGKKRATARLDQQLEARWRAERSHGPGAVPPHHATTG